MSCGIAIVVNVHNTMALSILDSVDKVEVAKRTTINTCQSTTLYYLKPFLMQKECMGSSSNEFRCHWWGPLYTDIHYLHIG